MNANPFASPQADTRIARRFDAQHDRVGAWHFGKLLIVGHETKLPARCVKCNAPTDIPPKRYRLAWHSPLVYLALPLGLFAHVVMALALGDVLLTLPILLLSPSAYFVLSRILRKKMTTHVVICDYHRFHRRVGFLIGAFGALLGFGLVIAGIVSATWPPALLGLLLAPALLLFGQFKSRIVWPKRIDKHFAQLRGACPEYLAELPEFAL